MYWCASLQSNQANRQGKNRSIKTFDDKILLEKGDTMKDKDDIVVVVLWWLGAMAVAIGLAVLFYIILYSIPSI